MGFVVAVTRSVEDAAGELVGACRSAEDADGALFAEGLLFTRKDGQELAMTIPTQV